MPLCARKRELEQLRRARITATKNILDLVMVAFHGCVVCCVGQHIVLFHRRQAASRLNNSGCVDDIVSFSLECTYEICTLRCLCVPNLCTRLRIHCRQRLNRDRAAEGRNTTVKILEDEKSIQERIVETHSQSALMHAAGELHAPCDGCGCFRWWPPPTSWCLAARMDWKTSSGKPGYGRALLLLCIVPLLWSLPTALMVGELASALPEDGGFYIWVSRALGRFWGFQEAWLSLSASIFDMAIYPALAVAYLGQLDPALTVGHRGLVWSLAVVVICVAWNLRGAYSVGQGSLWMLALLLTPFLGIVGLGLWRSGLFHHCRRILCNLQACADAARQPRHSIALRRVELHGLGQRLHHCCEVENPQRNYIRSMLAAVLLVAAVMCCPSPWSLRPEFPPLCLLPAPG